MPLQSLKLRTQTLANLKRKTRHLIKKGILYPSKKIDVSYTIGFCMHIQIVPKKQLDSFAFGKPEGIRAFIQSGNNVIAAADFLFAKERLKLSYLHYGHGLKLLLSTLNKLEKKYSADKDVYHAELIYFLLATGPYILIKSKKERQFYHSTPEKLTTTTPEKMKKQLTNILIHRDQTNKIN